MSIEQKSLTPTQIEYLKIGPKAGKSEEAKKTLMEAIRQEKNKQFAADVSSMGSINKIPKLTYGEYEKTVCNFGVLLNKNYGNETSVHQAQKFGKLAVKVNDIMIKQKDNPSEKKNALLKKIKDRSDNRTSIKTVYDFKGEKLFVTLKSFVIESQKSNEGGLPIPYLRFLINHVNSSRLTKILEPALKAEGNQVVVEFQKIENRASHFSNTEAKYQNIGYTFERLGQVLHIVLPFLEFHHIQSGYVQKINILNKEILEILDNNFDNVGQLVEKYLDERALEDAINRYGKEERNAEGSENDDRSQQN